MDNTVILSTIIQVPAEKLAIIKPQTHAAVANTENTYLGTAENGGTRVWKAIPIEYIVGALFPVMLKLSNTIRNFPNPPAGESIALRSPPTLPSVKPAFQSVTEGADIAAAAPRHWIVIFRLSEVSRGQSTNSHCRDIKAEIRVKEYSPAEFLGIRFRCRPPWNSTNLDTRGWKYAV